MERHEIHGLQVFPAYAGMIPEERDTAERDDRVPRIRGDDPVRGYVGKAVLVCSPHTRG